MPLFLLQPPSQRPRLPQELLVLVLLHLQLAPSPGADGVHDVVAAQALHVGAGPGRSLLLGLLGDGLLVSGHAARGGLHVPLDVRPDEGRHVGLVRLAAVRVRRLADRQDGREAAR